MNLPPLNALRAFEATARHLSVSRAGDELHVTHAAVSHQIKQLENWFGAALFKRQGRGIRLTPMGQILSRQASISLNDLSGVCTRLKLSAGKQIVSVGCIPSIASRWLIPNMSRFAIENPGVELQVLYAQAHERLTTEKHDVLITVGSEHTKNTVSTKLFSGVTRPVCSPHYLQHKGQLDSPSKVLEADLLHDETRQGWRDWFATAGVDTPDDIPGPVFQDFNLLATAAIAGHGVALCPVEIFRAELQSGDLIPVSEIETLSNQGYYLVTSASATTATKAFAQWFLSVAA